MCTFYLDLDIFMYWELKLLLNIPRWENNITIFLKGFYLLRKLVLQSDLKGRCDIT